MWNGFNNLSLAGVEAEQGRKTLEPGSYTVKVKNAEVMQNKSKNGFLLKLELEDVNGSGSINDFINVQHVNADAQKIGLSRLKAMLIAAGHPNPDRPGDVKTLTGLRVGVHVERDEDWTDKDGVVRKGGGKLRRSGAYFAVSPATTPGATYSALGAGNDLPDDDLPF